MCVCVCLFIYIYMHTWPKRSLATLFPFAMARASFSSPFT